MTFQTKRIPKAPLLVCLCLLAASAVVSTVLSSGRLALLVPTGTGMETTSRLLPQAHESAEKEGDDMLSRPLRIAIVQLLTPAVALRYALSTSQVGCWAARHGYYHHVETYADAIPGVARNAWSTMPPRIRDAKIHHAAKYLPHYDWILLLDSDVDLANMGCRIESYLPPTPGTLPPPSVRSSNVSSLPWRGEFDLVLGVREHTGEPMSGAVLIRNSPWGRAFLESWKRLSSSEPGRDNESMILALLEALNGTLPSPTLPCRRSPRYVCLYGATGNKVGRLPHVLLRPAFHHVITTLWKVDYGYFPHDCLVHGKEPERHLRPENGWSCEPKGRGSNWTRPELLLTEEQARDSIINLKRIRSLPDENFNGLVQHGKIAECYPNCLDDFNVSWTFGDAA